MALVIIILFDPCENVIGHDNICLRLKDCIGTVYKYNYFPNVWAADELLQWAINEIVRDQVQGI